MNISILVYGGAGVGKSVFASTFPKPLIIDSDNGHKLYEESKTFPNATYVRGDNCIPAIQRAVKQIKDGTNKFQTLVIDSLTALENQAVSKFSGRSSENWETTLYTNKGNKLNYDHWGNISGSSIALLTELKKYPVNIVVITQLSTHTVDGSEKYYPEVVGKTKNESLHFADFVCYMEKVEDSNGVVRLAHLNSTNNDPFVAKARLIGGYVQPMKNPSYEKLTKLISDQKSNLNFD